MTTFWFIVVAVLWAGFLVLEGFDFGVGVLHVVVGRDEEQRKAALATIGPVWDGNEVWLVTAGAVMFAAFPGWYATMFSGLYLALLLLLVALIARGAAIEFRGKRDSPQWRKWCSTALVVSGVVAPLLVGVALADLLYGLPIDERGIYVGGFADLFSGYSVFAGITFVAMTVLQGAAYLSVRGRADVRRGAVRVARGLSPAVALVVIAFVIWTHVLAARGFLLSVFELIAILAVLAAVWLIWVRVAGWAFIATTLTIAGTVLTIFANLYPRVMVSTLGTDLTVADTASAPYALKVMTVIIVILLPIVITYQAWAYSKLRPPEESGGDRAMTSSTSSSP